MESFLVSFSLSHLHDCFTSDCNSTSISNHQHQLQCTGGSFSAELLARSPQKLFIFIIYENIFRIKVSQKRFFLNLKTEAMQSTGCSCTLRPTAVLLAARSKKPKYTLSPPNPCLCSQHQCVSFQNLILSGALTDISTKIKALHSKGGNQTWTDLSRRARRTGTFRAKWYRL